MMKYLKIGLSIYLAFHVYSSLTVNFSAYEKFDKKDDQSRLNPFGKYVAHKANVWTHPEWISKTFKFQSSFTGTDKGYSFFSPNVSSSTAQFLFYSDGKLLETPLSSVESALKFKTASYYFEKNFKNKILRDKLLKSYARWYFGNNPELKELKVYLNLFEFEAIDQVAIHGYRIKHDKILGFILNRE